MKYTDIKSHKDACEVLKRDLVAGNELKDIADAINLLDDDYKPTKGSWSPYFWWDYAGGFGFSISDYDDWSTAASAGARLGYRFRNEKIADYFGTEFVAVHKKQFFS